MGQNLFFFHQKSEGIAFTFCRYLYQNMRAFIFCRYCPPIVFCPQIWKTKKSSKIKGNTLGILRRSFFPFNALGMPSFNNSAVDVMHTEYSGPYSLVAQIKAQNVEIMKECLMIFLYHINLIRINISFLKIWWISNIVR